MATLTMHEVLKGSRVNKKVAVNKVSLFVRAHAIAKKAVAKFESYKAAFSWALKKAYEIEWSLIDLLKDETGGFKFHVWDESEKAYKLNEDTGSRCFWVPKSAVTVKDGLVISVAEWAINMYWDKAGKAYA